MRAAGMMIPDRMLDTPLGLDHSLGEQPGTNMTATPPKDAIRNAATVVLVRDDGPEPRVLMGQRGKAAAFFPSKFVFPGGAIDPQDHEVEAASPLDQEVATKLTLRSERNLAGPLALSAIRELWEEAGLALSTTGDAPDDPPSEWAGFYAAGHRPNAACLTFIFRAITPPGRPRRFDARFFLADAGALAGDPDDFSLACDELSHLSWLTLADARKLDLPFITGVVLAEIEARLAGLGQPRPIPFFYTQDGKSFIDEI
ncbi:MAG: DNA mismatch repair protein MutT [Paracoccaceae bacterium]